METERGMRPSRWKWIAVASAFATAIVAVAITAWWLIHPLSAGDPQARVSAVQATFTITFGVGGLATLALFTRRQWLQERAHQLDQKIADDNRHDAEERRVTDLYVKATEQLGSDKAPVRLAGLHALDRLGQNYPDYRQQIADVYCAYLRMPYTVPPDVHARISYDNDEPGSPRRDWYLDEDADAERDVESMNEYEVRMTVQRLLEKHLRDPRPKNERTASAPDFTGDYWDLKRVDLSGATLIRPGFYECYLPSISFDAASFYDLSSFQNSIFSGSLILDRSTFHGSADFDNSKFQGLVMINRSDCHSSVTFNKSIFQGQVHIYHTRFDRRITLADTIFHESMSCTDNEFIGFVDCSDMAIRNDAIIAKNRFHRAFDFHGFSQPADESGHVVAFLDLTISRRNGWQSLSRSASEPIPLDRIVLYSRRSKLLGTPSNRKRQDNEPYEHDETSPCAPENPAQ